MLSFQHVTDIKLLMGHVSFYKSLKPRICSAHTATCKVTSPLTEHLIFDKFHFKIDESTCD